MKTLSRMLLSLASLLLAMAVFSLVLGGLESWFFIFRITAVFALPVWFINLAILLSIKVRLRRQWWMVPAAGAIIGPVCLALWCCFLVLGGSTWHSLWHGDPEAGGLESAMICASIIGLATNSFYMIATIFLDPARDAARLPPR